MWLPIGFPFESQTLTAIVHRDHRLQVGLNIIYRDIPWCKHGISWHIVILIFLYPWQHYFQSNELEGGNHGWHNSFTTSQWADHKLGSNSSPLSRMHVSVCVLSKRSLELFPVRSVHLTYILKIMSPLHKVPNNKCHSRPLTHVQISGILENRYIVVQWVRHQGIVSVDKLVCKAEYTQTYWHFIA